MGHVERESEEKICQDFFSLDLLNGEAWAGHAEAEVEADREGRLLELH